MVIAYLQGAKLRVKQARCIVSWRWEHEPYFKDKGAPEDWRQHTFPSEGEARQYYGTLLRTLEVLYLETGGNQ